MNTTETPMIVLPKIRKPTSGLVRATVTYVTKAGLVRSKSVWRASYRKNGMSFQKSLKTDDLDTAIRRRDELFAELRAQGATHTEPRPSAYIYRRPPYTVRIGGVQVGEFETEAEARQAKDEYLKANANK